MTDVWTPAPAAIDWDTLPPCGMWINADDVCCPPPLSGPCPAPEPACPEPSIDDLIRYAVQLICAVVGVPWTGWCRHVDEVCRECSPCGCTGSCARCCTRDELPVGDGIWPIVPGSVGVRRGDPDTGTIIPDTLYRLTDRGTLAHLGAGWPTCERLYIHYVTAAVPSWGPVTVQRLVCELLKLWRPLAPCQIAVTAEEVAAANVATAMTDPWVIDVIRSVAGASKDLGYGPRLAGLSGAVTRWTRQTIR